MNTRISDDEIKQNQVFVPQTCRVMRQLNSDKDFRKWFVGQFDDSDDPEATLFLLTGLTGPLRAEAAREVRPAVREVWQNASWPSLKLAAAAAMVRIEPAAAKENKVVQTLVEGLSSDEEGDPGRAVEALADLSADTRLRGDVRPALMSLIRDPGAEMGARCTALDALVCGHSIPEVEALVRSMAQADIPGPLRREAQCLLETWEPVQSGIKIVELVGRLLIPQTIREQWAKYWLDWAELPNNFGNAHLDEIFDKTWSSDGFTVIFEEKVSNAGEIFASAERTGAAQPVLVATVSTTRQVTNDHIRLGIATPGLSISRNIILTGSDDETDGGSRWRGSVSFGPISELFKTDAEHWEISIVTESE